MPLFKTYVSEAILLRHEKLGIVLLGCCFSSSPCISLLHLARTLVVLDRMSGSMRTLARKGSKENTWDCTYNVRVCSLPAFWNTLKTQLQWQHVMLKRCWCALIMQSPADMRLQHLNHVATITHFCIVSTLRALALTWRTVETSTTALLQLWNLWSETLVLLWGSQLNKR